MVIRIGFLSNKKAQFFILSAVIIASIIVGMVSVKNYAYTGDVPKKFYYYSQQLSEETGAVIDYALYTGEKGDLEKFVQQSTEQILDSSSGLGLIMCYTKNGNNLSCQNNGTKYVTINISESVLNLSGTEEVAQCSDGNCPAIGELTIENENNFLGIKINGSDIYYNVNLVDSGAQGNQFYFIFTMNTSSGNFVDGNID